MAAKEDFDYLVNFANRLFGDDDKDKKEKYVNEHMKQLGHTPVISWLDSSEENGGGNDDGITSLFGGSNRNKERRQGPPQRERKTGSESTWPY